MVSPASMIPRRRHGSAHRSVSPSGTLATLARQAEPGIGEITDLMPWGLAEDKHCRQIHHPCAWRRRTGPICTVAGAARFSGLVLAISILHHCRAIYALDRYLMTPLAFQLEGGSPCEPATSASHILAAWATSL